MTLVRGRSGSTGGGTGQDGTPGTPGSPGASAYEIAVANGFVGSQAAWLASLAGSGGSAVDATSNVKGVAALPDGIAGPASAPIVTGIASGTSRLSVAATDGAPSSIYLTTGSAAVYDPVTDRTILSYLGGKRNLYVREYDHATSAWLDQVFVGSYAIADITDSHGSPSMCIDGTGRYCVLYGTHNAAPKFARSSNPHDVTTWTVVTAPPALLGTYHRIVYEPTTDALYTTFRTGVYHSANGTYPAHEFGTIAKYPLSGAGANTWRDLSTSAPRLFNMTGIYGSAGSDFYVNALEVRGTRLYITWSNVTSTNSTKPHDGIRADVNIVYYDLTTGHLHLVDGTDIGTITPQNFAQARVVQQNEIYPLKLALDPAGPELIVAYNRYDSSAQIFNVQVAKWNGTAWSFSNTGIKHNAIFHGVYSRKRVSDGRWEVMGVRKTEAFYVSSPALFYNSAQSLFGGDLVTVSSDDAATWVTESVIPANRFQGGGASYLQMPKDARENLTAFVMGAAYDSATWWRTIYAVHRKRYDLAGPRELVPQWHYVDEAGSIIRSTQALGASATLDLTEWLPKGTTAVRLKVIMAAGASLTGLAVLSITDFDAATGSNLRVSDVQVSHRLEYTDQTTYDVGPIPIGLNRKLAVALTPSSGVSVGFRLRAIQIG